MAATEALSKETLDKHDQTQHPKTIPETPGDKKSDTGSASGPSAGKSTAPPTTSRRRMSRWQGASKQLSARLSLSSRERHSLLRLENTYKMNPDDGTKFNAPKVRAVTLEAMKLCLSHVKQYDKEQCTLVCKDLAEDIKNRVKELGFPRYKLVVNVVVGQDVDQGAEMASRCVWDVSNDSMTAVTHRQGDMYAIATVFGMYYE